MKVKTKYPFIFFAGDFEEMKPAKEDTFYEENGSTYMQFYKGQLIPLEIYNEVFGHHTSKHEDEIQPEVESEQLEQVDEVDSSDPVDEEEVAEKKPKQKRHKSIIKK